MNEEYEYGFIVDTNLSSSQFAVEMCAFMTGNTNSNNEGLDESYLYQEKYQPINFVIQKHIINKYFTPVHSYTTPNLYDNQTGYIYKIEDKNNALKHYKKYYIDAFEQLIEKYENCKNPLVEGWTIGSLNMVIQNYKNRIQEILNLTELKEQLAYASILIHMNRKPINHEIEFFKQRAYEFMNYYNSKNNLMDENKLRITDFRLFTQKIITQETIENIE